MEIYFCFIIIPSYLYLLVKYETEYCCKKITQYYKLTFINCYQSNDTKSLPVYIDLYEI
jgi:hypothetical protein